MSKDASAKYYQNNKERLQKKLVKDIKVFLKKKKLKSNMDVNNFEKQQYECEKFFHKHNEIWEKVSNIIEKEFNSELVYNKKYLKAEKKINAKKDFLHICTKEIFIDSVYRKDKNYYPKVFL